MAGGFAGCGGVGVAGWRGNGDGWTAAGGGLCVSRFTRAAEHAGGLRPGCGSAAVPEWAETVCDEVLQCLAGAHQPVASGVFGADMQVSLINDGPVTFLLET